MSITVAAKGERLFFEYIFDRKLAFVCQAWTISFDFNWYRIEDAGVGVQFIDGVPYWLYSSSFKAKWGSDDILTQEANRRLLRFWDARSGS